MKRLSMAAAAGALLVLYGAGSPLLPALPARLNIMVSSTIVLVLAAAFVWGLLPLRTMGRRLLLLAAAAIPVWVVVTWVGWLSVANVAKLVAAAALGLWIAGELERLSWIVVVACASAAIDVFSVAAGPTKAILAQGPVVAGYFTVIINWFGYAGDEAFTAIGVSDMIFFSLYLGAAIRFSLRPRASAVAMVVSFLVTMAAAMWWVALPALPLLAAAFLGVNADLLLGRLRPSGAGS